MGEPLLLKVEPPLSLSSDSRKGLQEARRKVLAPQQSREETQGTFDDVTQYDVLERAWIDERTSMEEKQLPMSVRLQKLWAERGDFSRFRASELKIDDGEAQSENDDRQWGDDNEEELEANLEGLVDEVENDGEEGAEKDGKKASEEKSEGDVMSIEEMRTLRTQMLERVGVAQNSMYFSHALISLLINSTKSDGGALAGARAGSVASTSGVAAHARTGGAPSASGVLQRSMASGGIAPSMGSASTLEAELGIEPYIFGASRIEAQRRQLERPIEDDSTSQRAQDDLEEDGQDDEEDVEKEMKRIAQQDAQLLDDEVEDRAKDLVERYEGKRSGIRSAIDILRKGAATIHPNNEGAGQEKVRWRALSEAKQSGWSLTPGKPARGTSAKKRELLEDYSSKRKEEAARDAWIGYGVPEAHPSYRRRALAYISHASKQGDSPVDALLFAFRSQRRLAVEVVAGDDVWTSSIEDDRARPRTLDRLLQRAQEELFDAELFETLVQECRVLSLAGLCQIAIQDEHCVLIILNPTTKVRFVLENRRDDSAEEQASGAPKDSFMKHTSPLTTAILSLLRLGLISRYRKRAGLQSRRQTVDQTQDPEEVKAPLLQPLLGFIHYASSVARLYALLESIKQRFLPHTEYECNAFDCIAANEGQGPRGLRWIERLLQEPERDGLMKAVRELGGSATIFFASRPVAFLTIAYPSQISLTLLLKRSNNEGSKPSSPLSSSKGVHLSSVELTSLERILAKELTRLTSDSL